MITINLTEVKELDSGEKVTSKRVIEGKMNYHSFKLSSEYYDKVNQGILEDTGKMGEKSLIETYNMLVMENVGDIEGIIEVLWFMFGHSKNANLSLENIEDFVNSTVESEEDMDSLREEVLIELEECGFFTKTIRQAYKGVRDTLIPMTVEKMTDKKTGKMDLEGQVFLDKLNVLISRGEKQGFLKVNDKQKDGDVHSTLELLE